MSVSGAILGGRHTFLVDSGASHNFFPRALAVARGYRLRAGPNARIQLADSSFLYSKEYLHVAVDFGCVSHRLSFTVLDVDCPLVLGMPFLRDCNPQIDWK